MTHVNSSRNSNPEVFLLNEDDWVRYRDIRLAALANDGAAFGGDLKSESEFTEAQWRQKAGQYVGLLAAIDGADCGFMTIENLKGDFGATCWVGSCWVDPHFRESGVLRSLFDFADSHSTQRNWGVQGLGVWVDNFPAITAYEKIGFEKMGEPQESSRKPGMYYQRMIRSVK
ncbi:MAG: GNAT family N-acetyltransferase [Actinobacteria bacterium]|nr:GNAT family N-acetyltransferase [Actinomycetota bacterium]